MRTTLRIALLCGVLSVSWAVGEVMPGGGLFLEGVDSSETGVAIAGVAVGESAELPLSLLNAAGEPIDFALRGP